MQRKKGPNRTDYTAGRISIKSFSSGKKKRNFSKEDMQIAIKMTVRDHFTQVRMGIIKKIYKQ